MRRGEERKGGDGERGQDEKNHVERRRGTGERQQEETAGEERVEERKKE